MFLSKGYRQCTAAFRWADRGESKFFALHHGFVPRAGDALSTFLQQWTMADTKKSPQQTNGRSIFGMGSKWLEPEKDLLHVWWLKVFRQTMSNDFLRVLTFNASHMMLWGESSCWWHPYFLRTKSGKSAGIKCPQPVSGIETASKSLTTHNWRTVWTRRHFFWRTFSLKFNALRCFFNWGTENRYHQIDYKRIESRGVPSPIAVREICG